MQYLYRLVLAIIVAVFLFAIMPPVLNIFQIRESNDLITIFRLCIGFGALIYVISGRPLSWPNN